MKNMLKNLFTTRHAQPPSQEVLPEERLAAQSEIQSLRLEIEARDSSIIMLSQEVERLRERQERLTNETASARFEALLIELAGPASQILTQADLLENQKKPVQARDVISVARRAVRAFERHGMKFENQPGDKIIYDPTRHTPIGDTVPQPGHPVTVRFAGVTYQGKMLYKTIVE